MGVVGHRRATPLFTAWNSKGGETNESGANNYETQSSQTSILREPAWLQTYCWITEKPAKVTLAFAVPFKTTLSANQYIGTTTNWKFKFQRNSMYFWKRLSIVWMQRGCDMLQDSYMYLNLCVCEREKGGVCTVWLCVRVHLRVPVRVSMCVFVCMTVCVCMCLHTCVCAHMCVHVRVRMCVCVWMCVCLREPACTPCYDHIPFAWF